MNAIQHQVGQAGTVSLHEALRTLPVCPLTITLRADESGPLPASTGSLLRGCLGAALKQVSGEAVAEHSAYVQLFECPRPADATVLRRASHVPQPFVLRPPLRAYPRLKRDESLRFELLLLGKRALEFYPQLMLALYQLAEAGLGPERVRCNLERISQIDGDGEVVTLLDRRGPRGVPAGAPLPAYAGGSLATSDTGNSLAEVSELTVELVTPAQLKVDGDIPREPSFAQLSRVLLRRLSSLIAFHGDAGPVELDYRGLIARAETVETVESELKLVRQTRYSARQGRRTPQRGLVGRVTYRGEAIAELMPIVRAGAVVHVGKGTSFGLGRMRIVAQHQPRQQRPDISSAEIAP